MRARYLLLFHIRVTLQTFFRITLNKNIVFDVAKLL